MAISEEYQHCKALVDWCRIQKILIIHIANEGKREFHTCHDLGIISGVSDYLVPFPQQGYQGLWIELKSKGKKPTHRQALFLNLMGSIGYMTAWCDSWDEARETIMMYFIDETIAERDLRISATIALMDAYKDPCLKVKPEEINQLKGSVRVTQPWANRRKLLGLPTE